MTPYPERMPAVETRPYGPGRRAAVVTVPLHDLSADHGEAIRERIAAALPGTDVLLIDRSGTVHATIIETRSTP